MTTLRQLSRAALYCAFLFSCTTAATEEQITGADTQTSTDDVVLNLKADIGSSALDTTKPEDVMDPGDITQFPDESVQTQEQKPPPPDFFGGERQAPYFLPSNFDPQTPMPVLVIIHGYTASGYWTADWWKMHQAANDAGVLLIIPEGNINPAGATFWNATEYCCNFYGADVDDVEYLTGLIDEAGHHFNVDTSRIYLMGHSNGGFMSHRIACDRSDLIAGIVNMGGSTWREPEDCGNPSPVSVLQVHGTWDTAILYSGLVPNEGVPNAEPINIHECLLDSCNAPYSACLNEVNCNIMVNCFAGCTSNVDQQACNEQCWNSGGPYAQILWMEALTCGMSAGCYLPDLSKDSFGYASVDEGAARWAEINGCASTQVDAPPLDLVLEINGVDTYPRTFEDCPPGLAADIWKIVYGGHAPGFNDSWAPNIINWLLQQSKPQP